MVHTEQLPKPNIQFLSDAEQEDISNKMMTLLEEENESELTEIIKKYPLPAEVLDDFKHRFGIDFLLRNEVNLANAVKKYGGSWIEA